MINKIMVAKQENAELDHAILNQEDVKLLGPGIELEAPWSCNFFMASQEVVKSEEQGHSVCFSFGCIVFCTKVSSYLYSSFCTNILWMMECCQSWRSDQSCFYLWDWTRLSETAPMVPQGTVPVFSFPHRTDRARNGPRWSQVNSCDDLKQSIHCNPQGCEIPYMCTQSFSNFAGCLWLFQTEANECPQWVKVEL